MILIPIAVLVALGVGAALLVTAFAPGGDDGDGDHGARVGVVGLAVVAVAVVLVVVLVVATVGVGRSRSTRDDATADKTSGRDVPEQTDAPSGDVAVDLVLRADASEFEPPPSVSYDAGGSRVLVIRAVGFAASTTGSIATCVDGDCRDRFPVIFDDDGSALFQYEVDLGASCAPARSCRLELASDDAVGVARIGGGLAGGVVPEIRLEPGRDARGNATVEIDLRGTDADDVRLLACPSDAERRRDCDRLAVRGSRVEVPARTEQVILVEATSGLPLIAPLRLDLETVGPRYSPARVGVGLAVGVALLVVAMALIRRTDWHAPASVAVDDA